LACYGNLHSTIRKNKDTRKTNYNQSSESKYSLDGKVGGNEHA